jgi:hypothetical protein
MEHFARMKCTGGLTHRDRVRLQFNSGYERKKEPVIRITLTRDDAERDVFTRTPYRVQARKHR